MLEQVGLVFSRLHHTREQLKHYSIMEGSTVISMRQGDRFTPNRYAEKAEKKISRGGRNPLALMW